MGKSIIRGLNADNLYQNSINRALTRGWKKTKEAKAVVDRMLSTVYRQGWAEAEIPKRKMRKYLAAVPLTAIQEELTKRGLRLDTVTGRKGKVRYYLKQYWPC